MSSRPRVSVLGNLNIDFVLRSDRLPNDGETLLARELKHVPGGKGANQAVAAARLGAQVTLIGKVGADPYGPMLIDLYRREGIDTRFVETVPDVHTGTAFVVLDSQGRNRILTALGANEHVTPVDVDAAQEAITGSDVLLVQLGVPLGAVDRAIEIAADAGVRVVLDVAPLRGALPSNWHRATVISPNETEAAGLLAELGARHAGTPAEICAAIRQATAATVVLKLGSQGAYWSEDGSQGHGPAFPTKVVDSTGAGDAFTAALGVRLAGGDPIAAATRFACAAGSLAASRFGAQPSLPAASAVIQLLEGALVEDTR